MGLTLTMCRCEMEVWVLVTRRMMTHSIVNLRALQTLRKKKRAKTSLLRKLLVDRVLKLQNRKREC